MTADHQKPTPTAFDPKDAKPGANPNVPSDLNDPRNPKALTQLSQRNSKTG